MLTLFNSLVRSKLEYCCTVWDPYKVSHINSIEQVQRAFTKRIKHMKDFDYWQRLKILNIMSLQRRREKLTILFIWKLKHNLVPNVVDLCFSKNTRNKEQAILKPMPTCRGKPLTVYENSFVVKGAKLWNKLPGKLTQISSLSVFRNKLDKYLSLLPNLPPVSGYYHTTDNSILSYKPVDF